MRRAIILLCATCLACASIPAPPHTQEQHQRYALGSVYQMYGAPLIITGVGAGLGCGVITANAGSSPLAGSVVGYGVTCILMGIGSAALGGWLISRGNDYMRAEAVAVRPRGELRREIAACVPDSDGRVLASCSLEPAAKPAPAIETPPASKSRRRPVLMCGEDPCEKQPTEPAPLPEGE